MKYGHEEIEETGMEIVTITLTGADLRRVAVMDAEDYLLIQDCKDSDLVSDKLLALELIARRIEESIEKEKSQ